MNLREFFDITLLGIHLGGIIIFCIKGLFIYAITQAAVSVVKFFFRRMQKKKDLHYLDTTSLSIIRRIIIYTLYIIGAAIFLSLIPGMKTVSNSILAGAGIMTVAVGFASQEALSNLISGLFIAFSKPFRIGDFIKVDEVVTGTVTEITLRHTIIRNAENRMIIIPNSKINSSTIINSTIGEPKTCSFIEVGVSYTVDLNRAIDVMRMVILAHPLLIDQRSEEEKKAGVPQVIIRVMNLGDSSITLRAWAWASNTSNAFVMKCELLKSIKERFDEEGIEIPYPYFNNIVKQE